MIFEVRSENDTDADYERRLGRARRYGAAEVVMVSPFAPGGLLVVHLLPDPADPTRWSAVATSARPEQVVRIPTLGIEMAGGAELLVTDDLQGRWVDGATAIRQGLQLAAERDRLAQQLRDAGMHPGS